MGDRYSSHVDYEGASARDSNLNPDSVDPRLSVCVLLHFPLLPKHCFSIKYAHVSCVRPHQGVDVSWEQLRSQLQALHFPLSSHKPYGQQEVPDSLWALLQNLPRGPHLVNCDLPGWGDVD